MRVYSYIMLLGIRTRDFPNNLWRVLIKITDEKLGSIPVETFANFKQNELEHEIKILTEAIFSEVQRKLVDKSQKEEETDSE